MATKREEQINQELKTRHETPHFNAGFVEGAKWADAHPRWISVEDELPQCNIPYTNWDGSASDVMESEKVIALIDEGEVCIATLNQNIDEETKKPAGEPYWFDEGKEEDGGWIIGKVTHWMPLPSAEHLKK